VRAAQPLEALALTPASSERRGSDGEPRSVPAITARRRDSRQRIEIEFSNGLERVGGRRAAQRLWQGFKPGGVGGLKRQQFGNRVVPALWPGPAIGRLGRLHNNNWRLLVTPPTQVVTANGSGGIKNIAFLNSLVAGPNPSPAPHTLPNAVAAEMFCTFWIETVTNPFGDGTFFQLQYSQTVNLNFAGLTWPHVSVATLVRSSVVA
jgi:hypothetical protein